MSRSVRGLEYAIAAGETLGVLVDRVNAMLGAGFTPLGQPFQFENGWAQALVRNT